MVDPMGRFLYQLKLTYNSSMDKRLYRSRDDKKIAGVCGGLAEYFGIDATIVRLIFVVLLLPGGLPGFIPYILLWIIVPLEPTEKPHVS
jgi:phage shock protein C